MNGNEAETGRRHNGIEVRTERILRSGPRVVQEDRTVRLGTWPGASGTCVRLLGTGALAVELEFLGMAQETVQVQRRFERISLPQGMYVAWYGGEGQEVSRVRTLGMGGLFISTNNPQPAGTKLILVFEVPGGSVQADAVVRSVVPDEGMGVEFARLSLSDRILLERLLKRLLR